MAILDWSSRYVISGQSANTLDTRLCVPARDRAPSGVRPEMFNRDQGAQVASQTFQRRSEGAGIGISMDGRGWVFDNIFIERLWLGVKDEEVYLKEYQNGSAVIDGLDTDFQFTNQERPHQALDDRRPEAVYYERVGLAQQRRHLNLTNFLS